MRLTLISPGDFLFLFKGLWKRVLVVRLQRLADDERTFSMKGGKFGKNTMVFAIASKHEAATRFVKNLEVEEELTHRLETQAMTWRRATRETEEQERVITTLCRCEPEVYAGAAAPLVDCMHVDMSS